MGGITKTLKKVVSTVTLGLVGDDSALKAQQRAAEQQRKAYEQQQLQLAEANRLSAGNINDTVANIATGAGSDVADTTVGAGVVRKRKTSTSTSLGVV